MIASPTLSIMARFAWASALWHDGLWRAGVAFLFIFD
jgi:hypothetical protein